MAPAKKPPAQRIRPPRRLLQTRGLATNALSAAATEEDEVSAAEARAEEAADEVVVAAEDEGGEDGGGIALRPATSLFHLRMQAIAENIAKLAPGGAGPEAEPREPGINFKAMALFPLALARDLSFNRGTAMGRWFIAAKYGVLTDILRDAGQRPERALADFLAKMEAARFAGQATREQASGIAAVTQEDLTQFFEIVLDLEPFQVFFPSPND